MALDLKRKLARLAPPPGAAAAARATELDASVEGTDPAVDGRTTPDPAAEPCVAPDPATEARDERLARIARLRALIATLEGRPGPTVGGGAPAGEPRTTVLGVDPDGRRDDAPAAPLPGETVETEHGPLHRVVQRLPSDHRHGPVLVGRALDVPAAALAALALDPALEGFDVQRMLLLDTETTGLAGGTGTLPFLVGMAWFEDGRLCVEQLLLRRPGQERPMLARLAERLDAASAVVTYNGKSFDWPLLRTRAVMNRVRLPAPAAHLDLLHCARRVFGRRLGRVRLVQVEREVLGMHRHDDVDGADIPEIYWTFVRSGATAAMGRVLEHNAHDLVALAGLVAVLAERWQDVLPGHDAEDRLGIAQVALRHGDLARASRFAEAAADGAASGDVATAALLVASAAARGRSEDHEVERLLRAALARAAAHERAAIHLRLAKHLEHRARDPKAALAHATETAEAEGDEACARRTARLERKLARRSPR
jgi:hypothetical protein